MMKIFSIRNVRNDIPWSLKVLSSDVRGDILLEKPLFFHVFSSYPSSVGISIVNARTVASLYVDVHFNLRVRSQK